MNHHDQHHQIPVAYPPSTVDGYNNRQYVMAPPPMGYPTKDDNNQVNVPVEMTSRGDGFWTGCLAGLCCCCCLDMCF